MIKLTLDHKALVYLIKEGGEDFAVELRGAVLKQAVKNAAIFMTEAENQHIKKVAREAIQESLGINGSDSWAKIIKGVDLDNDFKKAMSEAAQKVRNRVIAHAIDTAFNEAEVKRHTKECVEQANDRLNRVISRSVSDYIHNLAEDRIQAEVDRRLALIDSEKEGA